MRNGEFQPVPEPEATEAPQPPGSSEPTPEPPPPAPEPSEAKPPAPEPKPAKHPGGRKKAGADSVAEFLVALGDVQQQASVTVQRKKRGGAMGYCFRTEMDAFSMEELKTEYGGGSYRLTVRDQDETILFERTVEIVGKPKDPNLSDPEPAAGPASMLEIVEGVRREMRDGFERLRHPTPQAEAQNPLATALSIAEFFQKAQQPYLEAMLAKKDKATDPAEFIELLMKGMEIGQKLNPPSDPMAAVAANMAGPLLSLLQGRVPQEPAAVTPNPPESAAPETGARRPAWDLFLTPWMQTLQGWASKGKDPVMRADFVADEVGEDALQLLGEQLDRGDMFLAEFFTLHPETKPLEGWYRDFWKALREAIVWTEEEDEDEEGPAVEVGTHPPDEAEAPEGEKGVA